jgi:hypothetical protein
MESSPTNCKILKLALTFHRLDAPFYTSSIHREKVYTHFFLNPPPPPPKINSTTELISLKESIPWNQCPGTLKVKNFGSVVRSAIVANN